MQPEDLTNSEEESSIGGLSPDSPEDEKEETESENQDPQEEEIRKQLGKTATPTNSPGLLSEIITGVQAVEMVSDAIFKKDQ